MVPDLAKRILSLHSLTANGDHSWHVLPGSWPEERLRHVRELEEWLLRRSDDVLSIIGEHLALSGDDFLSKWERIDEIFNAGR